MYQKRKKGVFQLLLLLFSGFFLFVPLAVAPSACPLVADATAISTLEDYLAFEDVNTALRSVEEPNIDINLETVINQLNHEPRLSSDLEKLARGLEKRGGRELREAYIPLIRTQGPLQPRYGSFVLEEILDKNREAYASLRATMLEKSPNVVIGMERGGALAGEIIVRGTPLESRFFPLPKTVDPDGKYRFDPSSVLDFVQGKISAAKAENARLGVPDKQVRIAFTDSFFGGRFAHELKQEVVRRLIQRQENANVHFESYWIRERFGFEKQTAEGFAPLVDKDSLRFPAGSPYANRYDIHLADTPFVLGDDVDLFFDGSATPLVLFDNQGKVTKIIRPQKTSRDTLIELLIETPVHRSPAPSPEIVAANRAVLGIGDDVPPELRKAVDQFNGFIVCKTGITGAVAGVGCSALVSSVEEEAHAELLQKLFAERGITIHIERSADFGKIIPIKVGEVSELKKLLEASEIDEKRLEEIVTTDITGFDGLDVKVMRGMSDTELIVLVDKDKKLAERLGFYKPTYGENVEKNKIKWGYEHAKEKHKVEFGDSQNIFDNWIRIFGSTSHLQIKSGRSQFPNRILHYVHDPVEHNIIVMVTDDKKFMTLYRPTANNFVSELENGVKEGILKAYKTSDNERYILLKKLPDGRKHIVTLSRTEGTVIVDLRTINFDETMFEEITRPALERFTSGKDKIFGDLSTVLPSCNAEI